MEGSDQEISDLLEECRILAENKYAGVRTAAACLDELTIRWKGSCDYRPQNIYLLKI